jgi:hypothetical protein
MKKTKSKSPSAAGSELPKWRQAFQKPAVPDRACPEPEQVISSALQELPEPAQQQVQDHLLSCRDCLELYLDVRSAQAEADSEKGRKFGDISEEEPSIAARLAVLGHKVLETLQVLGKPRRLIPALAAVSLVVLVFMLGREEKSKILPPAQLAEQREAAPATPPPSAAPSEEPAAVKSLPAPSGPRLLTSRRQAETTAALKKKTFSAAGGAAEPIRLDFAEVIGNGARLSYRANRDVYAYLFRQDQNGKISLVYSGDLEASKTYYYPAREYLLKSDPAATKATFFLVASANPVTDPEARLKELELLGKDQLRVLFPQATIRSLSVTLP